MSNYQTNNPVPSIDPRDLDDNATNLDFLVNGPGFIYPDRLGVPRKSYAGMEADVAGFVSSPNLTALSGLTGAADRLAYFTGVGAMALTPLTAVARALLDDTTVAAQRATLGLGTAAVADLTTSNIDSTPGRATKVGDYGWGSPGNATPLYTVTPATMGNTSPSAVVQALTTDVQATVQSPVSGEEFGGVHTVRGIRPAQFGVSGRGATASLWYRGYSTAAPLLVDWLRGAKAGANSDITGLTGLTTPLSVAQGGSGGTSQPFTRANSIGTVSQIAGVPTGAAFETGGTLSGTGKFFKHADGYMKIIKLLTSASGSTTAKGQIFTGPVVAGGALPVNFVGDLPIVTHSGTDSGGGGWTAMEVAPTLSAWGSYSVRSALSSGTSAQIYLTAEGRWF